jgi:hypothetical protein
VGAVAPPFARTWECAPRLPVRSGVVPVREPFGRWAPAPLPPNPSAEERREWRLEETALKHQVRWIWNDFCSGVELTRRIVPTGYATREPPRLGDISLGPPTRFNVELRPGQLVDDLVAVSDRLAAAYLVDDVDIWHVADRWIRVELIEYGMDDPRTHTTPIDPPRAPAPGRPDVRTSGRHWPRRQHRGPTGGPQVGS